MQMANPADEMNECRSLFLAEIQEAGHNSLKLIVGGFAGRGTKVDHAWRCRYSRLHVNRGDG
jgi:hypothetical protein